MGRRSLRVIALISGGKDSFFSMLHCLANGHQVIASANLHPPASAQEDRPRQSGNDDDWDEDTDSFMYQTAGHHLIPLYSEALSVPLYREEIREPVRDTSKVYQIPVNGPDELDSLRRLLSRIKSEHPNVDAVSSGAILSTYQRTRVESVAMSLGLIPLAYLWQYPCLPPRSPGGLLSDMRAVGLDVRIIKTASGGLDETLLWQNLLEPKITRKVERAMCRFGGSVLGEGGEYETLVLNGPQGVWQGKVEVLPADLRAISTNEGTAVLQFKKGCGTVVMNESSQESRTPRIPEVWDPEFQSLLARAKAKSKGVMRAEHCPTAIPSTRIAAGTLRRQILKDEGGKIDAVLNMTSSTLGETAEDQMQDVCVQLNAILKHEGLESTSLIFTTLLLHSMSDFAAVNSIYGTLFSHPIPPARVTVACLLPANIRVSMSIIFDKHSAHSGLHVQSWSYWAPANIGPYSQAISVPLSAATEERWIYVAGQIPLDPASMEVHHDVEALTLPDAFLKRACLSLQHMWRIGLEMRVDTWSMVTAFLTGNEKDAMIKAALAWDVWQLIHDQSLWEKESDDDDGASVDVWDLSNNPDRRNLAVDEQWLSLPNFSKQNVGPGKSDSTVPGFLAVHVNALPRECDIEWQGLGFSGEQYSIVAEDTKVSNDFSVLTLFSGSRVRYVACFGFSWLPGMEEDLAPRVERAIEWLRETTPRDLDSGSLLCTLYAAELVSLPDQPIQVVPCHAVWGPRMTRLAAAMMVVRC